MVRKYEYHKVIQQNYGQGWEDVSEYETNSLYVPTEKLFANDPSRKTTTLLKHDLKEYRLTGCPTRVINRRTKIV